MRQTLLLPVCFGEMSLVGEFSIKLGVAGGLLAGDKHGPSLGYLDFNSFSQKAMDPWLHQGEGDDLSTADLAGCNHTANTEYNSGKSTQTYQTV